MSTTSLISRPARSQSLVLRHPLISFFVLTYAIAWLLWAPWSYSAIASPTRWHSSFSFWDPSRRPQWASYSSPCSATDPACAHCSDACSMPGSDCAGTWPLSHSRCRLDPRI